NLREARDLALAQRVSGELVAGVGVRPALFLRDGKGAELALHAADVRLVQVQVLDEEDAVVAAAHAARGVRELAEPQEVSRLEENEPVLEVESLRRDDLLADRLQRVGDDGHQDSRSMQRWASASSSSRCSCPSRQERAWRA